MFFGKSYSSKSLTLATNAMRVIDQEITFDLMDNAPEEIPKDHEWQMKGLGSIFDGKRKRRAEQRVAFNHGLMTGVANHFFDGSPSDLDKFVRRAVIDGVFKGKTVVRDFGKMERKHPHEFSIGYQYADGFIERHLRGTLK